MLSIANSNGIDEVRSWTANIFKASIASLCIEYKIDGLALSIVYKDGLLQHAVTRGNGTVGDDVTANVLRIKSIPKIIQDAPKGILEIRGEVVWYKDKFDAFNKLHVELGNEPLSNPRNGAAGTLKSKDPEDVAKRNLDFIAYSIVRGSDADRHSYDLAKLVLYGFTTSTSIVMDHFGNGDAFVSVVADKCEIMRAVRHDLPFLIDGLVIKVDHKEKYEDLGGTSKTPHWLTAYKFPPEEKETELLYIEESYSRTGTVTPVAVMREIDLALTKVNRASLHNWDMVEWMGLYPGCRIVVRKAGEIIPEVVSCVETNRRKEDYEKEFSVINDSAIRISKVKLAIHDNYLLTNAAAYRRPSSCKHCNTTLRSQTNSAGESLVAWICPNSNCTIKQVENVIRFVHKDAMNIFGVGDSLVEQLMETQVIKDASGLYELTADRLAKLDFKEKTIKNILTAIEQSKSNGLDRLIVGFCIPGIGRTASKILADKYRHLEFFRDATYDQLTKLENIGDESAKAIIYWLRENEFFVDYFIRADIACKATSPEVEGDCLKGKSLIMTGSFDGLDRDEFKKMVVAFGGKVSSSISKSVDYVLLGEGAGPAKIKSIDEVNAKTPGRIQIIDDKQFLQMIGK